MVATGIRPPTVQEAVLRELRRYLVSGRLRPGDPVRVDQIAEEFGVSAVPVREALGVLVGDGRVQYVPHRGYTVTVLSHKDVEEIFLICRVLEAEAFRRGVPTMDEAAVDRMNSLLRDLETMPREDALWDRVVLHQDFHFIPIHATGLPRLEAELRRLWDHTDHYRGLYSFTAETAYRKMYEEHEAIAKACAARDAELVVTLMDRHREHALLGMADMSGPDGQRSRS